MKHQTQKITEHVMRLWRDAQQNGYLITGKSRAALITKDGSEADKQLKSVWELTDKPVTVLLSDGRLGSSGGIVRCCLKNSFLYGTAGAVPLLLL